MGKREEAAPPYGRALSIYEKILEPSHPKVGGCRKNLERCQRSIAGSDNPDNYEVRTSVLERPLGPSPA